MNIIFLHLSDLHLENESNINDIHLQKIVHSLNTYKVNIDKVIIVISGDITQSGEKTQFDCAWKVFGTLMEGIRNAHDRKFFCDLICVPGNHDMCHNRKYITSEQFKERKYAEWTPSELKKLDNFFNFAKRNHCFVKNTDDDKYYSSRFIVLNGYKLKINLINTAVFSSIDEDKGLHYISSSAIKSLEESNQGDFVITVMHHAPDWYLDSQKNRIEPIIYQQSSVVFLGHEHNNIVKTINYGSPNSAIIQAGGCLCEKGDWSLSSFSVGLLDTDSKNYEYRRFSWQEEYQQYEYSNIKNDIIKQTSIKSLYFDVSQDFEKYIYSDDIVKQTVHKRFG